MSQIKKVWVPVGRPKFTNEEIDKGAFVRNWYPPDSEETTSKWSEVESLVGQGWKVVATVPVVGSMLQGGCWGLYNAQEIRFSVHSVLTFTTGFEVILTKE